MGWQTHCLILKLMLLALSTAAASVSASCQTIVTASNGGNWWVGGRGQVSCACEDSDVYVGDLNLTLQLGNKRLPTEIVNNTVRYTETSATESVQDTYECCVNKSPNSSVPVRVFAVLNVTDFSCRFDVEEKLNCSFSRADGEEFHVNTTYELEVSNSISNESSKCEFAEPDNTSRMHCMLNMNSYAHDMSRLNFTLTMISKMGGGTQTQQFELLGDNMFVPKWPSTKPNWTTVTNNKTCLVWDSAKVLADKGETLEWVVELRPRRPDFPPLNLTLPGLPKTDQRKLKFCFPHPPQGFQVFDVRLKMHIEGNNTFWSEYHPEFAISTNATVPARPPRFMRNGFSYDKDSKELTVLWYPLAEIYHNGPNLTYDVYLNDNHKANRIYGRSAIFENWDDSQPANVIVRSRNSVGASLDSGVLLVPAISDVAKRRVTQLKYIPYRPNDSPKLSWDKPEDTDHLSGYTIYWCQSSNKKDAFCQDVGITNNITLHDVKQQEYKFNRSMADQDMALEPMYMDRISSMSIVLAMTNQDPEAFTLRKAQIMEGIGALLVLGLVIMSVRKLRKMSDIDIDKEFINDILKERKSVEPKTESKSSPRQGVPRIHNAYELQISIFTEEQQEREIEEQPEREIEEELVVPQTEPESSPYVVMNNGNPTGRNDDIRPPSPRINPNSNGYVMEPPPRFIPNFIEYISPPNNEGYTNPPPPRLNPNNEGYTNPPPPRLNPNNEGYINPSPPRLHPNNEGYINPSPPRLNPNNNPNNNGYVMAPPPRSIPNNNGYVDPPLPRLIPNSDGYINPSHPQG